MPGATTSGADASANGGAARNREHNQGNQERKYSPEQAAAVLRIRRCKAMAFYEILEVQKTCTDGEVKKAYRKQSLLTHPDKNGHPNADEAFKMVSRAFGVLGDKDKRDKFDRFGTDPDSRSGGAAQPQNPFSGFASRAAGGRGPGGGGGGGWDDEISPEEMFQRFFGGGFGGGGKCARSRLLWSVGLSYFRLRQRSGVCLQLRRRTRHPRTSVRRGAAAEEAARGRAGAGNGSSEHHHRPAAHPPPLRPPAPLVSLLRRLQPTVVSADGLRQRRGPVHARAQDQEQR